MDMEFDILLKLLNEKIVSLRDEAEKTDKNKEEIVQLQDIVRKVKDDPYCLYTSDDSNYVRLLGYSSEQLQEIEKCKRIYGLYVQFGMDKDVIPQISIVEESAKKIEEDLERKVMLLSDVIARHQAIILGCQSYENLLNEIKDKSSYVTEIKALLELLNESNLEVSERNKIKRAVIAKNNLIYQQTREVALEEQRKAELAKKAMQQVSVVDESTDNLGETESDTELEVSAATIEERFETEEEREIAQLTRNLEHTFGKCTIKRMQELVRTILSCENDQQINDLLDGYKFSNSEKYLEMVDGLISLMRIDILMAKYFSDEEMIKKYNQPLLALEEYRVCLSDEQKAEVEAIGVDVDGLKDFEKALQEYDSNPLSTPNQVIFLNNAVGRDIASIKDKTTLQDIFLLIEGFRKGEIRCDSMSDLEMRKLKPNKKGRQARVMLLHIDNNVYGVVCVHAKKDNRTPFKFFKNREAKGFTAIENLNSGEVLMTDLIDYTSQQMDKLVSRISNKPVSTKGGLA